MFCPGCGSGQHYVSNLIDEMPFVEAAQAAPQLRHFGNTLEAGHVLRALWNVKISNFLRPRWRCVCGVKFDG